ncbi:outer membrane protein assembly factor BamB family protein [Luteipulveratus halotolerans]|nr:PQQ-binding-like beta-propeller repeat protein [Luteipulveratus halotolerans]
MTGPAYSSSGVTRRRLLAMGGALSAGALLPQAGAAAAAAAPTLRFAMVTDTHANVTLPQRSADLRRALDVVSSLRPDVVLHCGDITDYGAGDEFAAYRASVPNGLWDRMKHVPGNHESRWDATGLADYRRWFGPEWSSFAVGGVHFAGLAPVQLLQEPGYFGREGLDRVRAALSEARTGTPAVCFLHYPLGGRNYFVNDTDDVLTVIQQYSVRAVLAGHVHQESVSRFNGLTQVSGINTYNGPSFYWFERTTDGGSLTVTRWTVPAVGEPTQQAVTSIDLAPGQNGLDVRPAQVAAVPGPEQVTVSARFGQETPASVSAQLYPQGVFGGTSDGQWTPLVAGAGATWSATLPSAALVPGEHRVQIRSVSGDGARYESVARMTITAPGPRIAWSHRLDGAVQGGLLGVPEGVVAATTTGEIARLETTEHSARPRWSRRVGPVLRAPAALDEGRLVVPSIDHNLYALRTEDGALAWRSDLGAPVAATPTVAPVDGEPTVLVAAGNRLHALTSDGRQRWAVDNGGMFAGRAACDGTRVVVGSGDGLVRAYDARTGARLWTFETNTRTAPYQRLIYGAWGDTIELLPGGGVLVSTVSGAVALDAATGAVRWRRAGSYIYTPALVTEHGCLLVTEFGIPSCVDPTTGATRWSGASVVPRSFEAGPVRDGSNALLLGAAGLLARIDLATGASTPLLQTSTANTFATPVIVGAGGQRALVAGYQDGVVRAITGW